MVTVHDMNKGGVPSVVPSSPVIATTPMKSNHKGDVVASKFQIEPHDGKVTVYYGSNMGTCENISSSLCDEAAMMGFNSSLKSLDDAVTDGLDPDRLHVIVASTYNGQPPDNAKKFAKYMKTLAPGSLEGVKVAILGVGNSNWKSFQAFPALVEESLRDAGATIFCKRGIADEEKDIEGDVNGWQYIEFWPSSFEIVGLDSTKMSSSNDNKQHSDLPELVVADSTEQGTTLLRSTENKLATVMSARELQLPGSGRSTRHVELKLPKGLDYCEGDHLAVFPENNPELVLRIASLIKDDQCLWDLGKFEDHFKFLVWAYLSMFGKATESITV